MILSRHSLLPFRGGRLWSAMPVAGPIMKNMNVPRLFLVLSGLYSISACSRADVPAKEGGKAPPNAGHLFTRLPSSYTGV